MSNQDFQLETLAELTALNAAIHRILKHLAKISGEPDTFLRQEQEAGIGSIERQSFWGVTEEQSARVRESAIARYSDLISCVSKSLKD